MFLRADAVHPRIFRRCITRANAVHQINEEITDKEIRLIGNEGEQLGIMSADEALRIAAERELDLVKIAPGSNPPVCKIMDYGKYRFEQAKKEKDAKKNQRVIEIKEIRMSPGIGDNDFNTKLKNGQKFLNDGNRVKVSVRFRGREMAHTDIGEVLLRNFAEKCADIANLDKAPKLEGRNMSMFLSPKPQTPPKKPAKPRKLDGQRKRLNEPRPLSVQRKSAALLKSAGVLRQDFGIGRADLAQRRIQKGAPHRRSLFDQREVVRRKQHRAESTDQLARGFQRHPVFFRMPPPSRQGEHAFLLASAALKAHAQRAGGMGVLHRDQFLIPGTAKRPSARKQPDGLQ